MQRLADAVARILAMPHAPSDSRLARELDTERELQSLTSALDALRSRERHRGDERPSGIDVIALLAKWSKVRPEIAGFSRRELRALCWETEAAGDPAFLAALARSEAYRSSPRLLRGLWFAHQQRWRLPTADIVESLLREAASQHGRRLPRWLRSTAMCPGLLSEDAVTALVRELSQDWRSSRSRIADLSITSDGELGRRTLAEAVATWTKRVVAQRDTSGVDDLLAAGVEGLLAGTKIEPGLFTWIVEQLVGAVNGAPDRYRRAISHWILHEPRLGHPARVRTRGHWAGISATVRKLAVQLFAARDLGAFFEVLIGKSQDSQLRRPFWERYVNSPQLVNFAIACDHLDGRKLVAALGRERADVASLVGAPDYHSCFVMHFSGREEVVIAEMSQPNKAMYLFTFNNFLQHVGSLEEARFSFDALRSQTWMRDRWVHRGDWHYKFFELLARYGVFPERT